MRFARGSFVVAALFISAVGCKNSRVVSSQVSIGVDALALDFGNQTAGTQTSKPLTVTNTGTAALNITAVAIGSDLRGAFSLGPTPQELAAGSSAIIEVTYTAPQAQGSDGATLTISSNATGTPELSISLTARSLAACVPESDAAFCVRLGKNCGVVTAADNCGAERTVSSCGACTSPETCAGLGVANVCDTPLLPLTVALAGAGSGTVVSTPGGINCGAACTASFSATSTVTLTAVPDASSAFAGFSGDCSGMTCSFAIDAAANVTATFIPLHTLTVLAGGSGSGAITSSGGSSGIACTATSGSASGMCSAQLPEGTVITLAATPGAGSRFSGWTGACTGATCSITLTGDLSATGSFVATYPVSVALAGSGTGAVTSSPPGISCSNGGNGANAGGACSAPFDSGGTVTLTPAPGGGSAFSGFSGACTGAVCALANLSAMESVTASFAAPATKLVFTQQPENASSAAALSPAVTVSVEDAFGNVVLTSSATIALAASGGALAGTTSVQAVNGVATFSDLSMALAGSYTLMASSSGLASATSSSFTITAGRAAQLVFSQQPSNAQSGVAIAPAVTVTAEDAAGNIDTTFSDLIGLALDSGAGTLSNASQPAAGGVATFAGLALTAHLGNYQLLASSGALAPAISNAFAISAGSATHLVFTQAPPATAQSGVAMAQAVKVSVEDAAGNVVVGSSASISLSSSGGALSGGAARNAVSGVATFSGVSLAGSTGNYTLSAQGSGFTSVTSSAIALSAGLASQLVFTQEPPATAKSGVALSQAVKVSVEDASGNVVTTSSAPISLAASAGTLTGGNAQNASSGVATFSLTLAAAAGSYTLSAQSGSLPAVTSTAIALSAGNPSQLVFTQEPPAAAQSGIAFTQAVKVAVEDANGNVVTTSSTPINLVSSAGILTGGNSQNATAGVASFTLTLAAAAGSYTLGAQGSGFTTVTSTPIALSAGTATQLIFTQEPPATAQSGIAMSQPISVSVEDATGNVVTTSSASISLAPSGGVLTGGNAQSAVHGIATFNLTLAAAAGNYTLTAQSSGFAPVASSSIALFAGGASQLVFIQEPPASAQSGVAMAQAIQVAVEDSNGNIVTASSAPISLSPSAGVLTGGNAQSAVNGVATFSLTLAATAGSYTLTAQGSGFASVASSPIALSAGNPAQLVFTQQPPAAAQSGISFAQAVKVSVEDANGNVVNTSSAPISLVSSGGTLAGGNSQNASSGVATFALALAGSAGNYTLSAQSSGFTSVTSSAIALSAGTASQLVITQQPPGTAQSGIAFSQAVKVSVEDANGNVVTTSAAPISLASSGGTLTGGTSQNANSGVATFSLALAGTAGNYTLSAQSSGFTSVTSSAIALSAGTASQLVITQQPPGTAQSGIAFSQAVKVSIEDANGNVVTTSTAPINLAPSGGTLTGGNSQNANSGVAAFSLALAGSAGNYTLSAQSTGFTSVTSSAIALSAGTASQLVFTQQPPAAAQSGTSFAQAVTVSVEDATGNVVTTSAAPISLAPSGGTLTGGNSQNATNGVATFALTLAGTVGNYTLSAQSTGFTSVTSSAIALSAGTASQLVITQQPPATAQSGIAFTQAVTVAVEDANGNVVTTSAAPLNLVSSGGTLTGGASQNATSGVATFALTLAGTAGNYTLSAQSTGFTSVTSSAIALAAGTASQLVFTQQPPAAAQSGIAFSQAVTVAVEDANGNVVTTSAAPINLVPSGGTLTGGASQNATNGVATFALTLAGTIGNYTLSAQSSGFTSVTSSAIALSAGTASQLVFTQEPPAAAQSGIAFTQAVKVSVEDGSGNVVTGSAAQISLTPSGGTLSGGGAQAASSGVATFTPTLTGTAGNYTVIAASTGLTSATSSGIALTVLTPQWATQYKDMQRSSRLTTSGPAGMSLRWHVNPTGAIQGSCPLIAGDGTVYLLIYTGNNVLIALNPTTGAELHRYAVSGNDVGCPTLASDGTIYTGYGSGSSTIFVALKSDFTEKWRFTMNSSYQGDANTLIGSDGTLYVTDPIGRTYQVTDQGTSGKIGWEFPAAGQPATKHQIYTALSNDSKTVYLATATGNNGGDSLYAVSTADGTLWATYGPFTNPVNENWRNVSVAPSGMVLAQSADPGYNITPSSWGFPGVTGPLATWTDTWKQPQQGWFWDQGAIDTDGTFYPTRQDGYPPGVAHLWKINPDGSLAWTSVIPGWSHGTVVDSNHMLYISAGTTLEELRPSDETVVWSTTLASASSQMAMGNDGSLYVTTSTSDVYAFQPPAAANRKVLVTLGTNASGIVTQEAELFDPTTSLFTPVGNISYTPSTQTAGGLCAAAFTLLGNGEPLVASGGCTDQSGSSNLSSRYNPTATTWAAGANMVHARDQAASVTLQDGRGMVIGGCAGGCSGPSGLGEFSSQVDQTVEIYDPMSNKWTQVASMSVGRGGIAANGAAVTLADGRVMVCGGNDAFRTTYSSCEIYTVSSNAWAATGSLPDPGTRTLLLLPDATVMALKQDGTTALRWTPSTGAWTSAGTLLTIQQNPQLTLLANGAVLVSGGMNPATNTPLSTAELYAPSTNTFTATGSMTALRGYGYSVLLGSGKVLAGGGCNVAGCDPSTYTKTAELYDPAAGTWSSTGSMTQERGSAKAALLP